MWLPKYAENPIYMILADFAKRMDLEILYKELSFFPDNVLAYIDVYPLEDKYHKYIFMPIDDSKICDAGKDPIHVLAHEMTHYLIENYYINDKLVNTTTSYPLRLMLENDCDRMGLALVLLAESISEKEEEKKRRSLIFGHIEHIEAAGSP